MKDTFIGFSTNPFPTSGWFPYPHELVTYWSMLKHRELLALNYILRHTIGFQKSSDSISYSQFLEGVGNIDNGCGIKSTATLSLALQGLVDKGFITKEGGAETGRTNHYSLVYKKHDPALQDLVTSSSDSKEVTPSKTKDTINTSINILQYINSNNSDKCRSIEDIEDKDLVEIADKYHVPVTLVKFELEKLWNYCSATGKTYKDYRHALSSFVLSTIQKTLEKERINNNKKGVDYSHLK
jgi:DNA-binding HxlR family transcriptional regulator